MVEPTRRQFLAGGIGALALGALAACGGNSSSGSSGGGGVSSTSTRTYTLAELEDNAQKEGGTLVYYTLGQDIADAQIKGFTAKYPWAKISTRIDNGRRTLTKIVQEYQAKAPTADVFVNTSGTTPLSVRKQVAALTKVPNDAQTPGAFRDLSGYGHAYYQNLQALAYNTNLITTPLPTDIYDLGDASFRGKIAMDNPQNAAPGYFFLSSQRKKWGDEKWNTWLKAMKANDIFLTQSATSAYQAVVAGERAIAPDNADDVLSQKAGTPVKLAFYQGVPTQIFYLYTSVRVKHPYTANLFINWSLSEDGQKAIASTGRSPIVKIDTPLSVDKILPTGITVATEEATNDLVNNQSTYMSAYDSLWPV
jgi:ABC-type Fe3+ transport system substrate-binding protein